MWHKQKPTRSLSRREILKYGLCGGLIAGLPISLRVSGCGKEGEGKRNGRCNVLLICLDTVRRDHCSAYGYNRETTPNLCAFAKQSTSFDLAYAPTSTTGPTHASIFTCLYPIAHHVLKNGWKLSEEYETLAEIFSAEGYQSASVVSSFALHAKFGYAQGFSYYDDDFADSEATVRWSQWEGHKVEGAFDRRADYTTKRTIDWLKSRHDPDRPFFLFVHYFDPHNPYTPPEPFASRFTPEKASATSLARSIGRYDAEIAFTDQELGNLFTALKTMDLAEQTFVVIFSDHGEGLMDHGHMYHGVHIYEEAVRVPLLFRWPGCVPAGRVLSSPVGLINLAPTILELVGIEWNWPTFQGRSFASAVRGETSLDPAQTVYVYRRHYKEGNVLGIRVKGDKFGIRSGKWKYIEGEEEGTKELFNLEADPREMKNLSTVLPQKTEEFASQLREWKQTHGRARPVQDKISEEDLERLRSLGYVE